jgi:hypothetical protein
MLTQGSEFLFSRDGLVNLEKVLYKPRCFPPEAKQMLLDFPASRIMSQNKVFIKNNCPVSGILL